MVSRLERPNFTHAPLQEMIRGWSDDIRISVKRGLIDRYSSRLHI